MQNSCYLPSSVRDRAEKKKKKKVSCTFHYQDVAEVIDIFILLKPHSYNTAIKEKRSITNSLHIERLQSCSGPLCIRIAEDYC